MNHQLSLLKLIAIASLTVIPMLVSLSAMAVPITTVSTFTGGDLGEGLDLDIDGPGGSFLYAVNAGGSGQPPIRDATFTNQTAPGVTVVSQTNTDPYVGPPEFGGTNNDNRLETVMQSITWSAVADGPPTTVDITLAGLVTGTDYKLQLLFSERAPGYNLRGFDVFIEGSLVVDDFRIVDYAAPASNIGVVITHTFTAGPPDSDSTLNIVLGGGAVTNPAITDFNPIIQGLTLEALPIVIAAISEPGTLFLVSFSMLMLLLNFKVFKAMRVIKD